MEPLPLVLARMECAEAFLPLLEAAKVLPAFQEGPLHLLPEVVETSVQGLEDGLVGADPLVPRRRRARGGVQGLAALVEADDVLAEVLLGRDKARELGLQGLRKALLAALLGLELR